MKNIDNKKGEKMYHFLINRKNQFHVAVFIVFCTFWTIVIIFGLQKKKFKEEDELLHLDLQWKNTPYAKIRESLTGWNQELTFFGPPVAKYKNEVKTFSSYYIWILQESP